MPPILPRPTLLSRAASSIPPTTTPRVLFFSSTATVRTPQQRVPPESPLFINVPNPPQDQSVEDFRELKPVRGFVPPPRQIFRRRDGHLKPQKAWLDRSAPEPSSARSRREPQGEVQAWKRRMAASRRENMREGVRELYSRRVSSDRQRLAAQTAKLASNRAAAEAPDPEDERLTRASVNAATLRTAVAPDPERHARALESRARTAALLEARSAARRDAVLELYMNARSFIVSEPDLEARVDELFRPDYWRDLGVADHGGRITNIWELEGKQPTVASMMRAVTDDTNNLLESLESETTRTHKRQQRIAEELTGGKMDADVTSRGRGKTM